jgi:hypothetical protein
MHPTKINWTNIRNTVFMDYVQWLRFTLSNGCNRLVVSLTSSGDENRFSFRNVGFRTMDKVQEPNHSECYTPSSEPFEFYLWILINLDSQISLFMEANIEILFSVHLVRLFILQARRGGTVYAIGAANTNHFVMRTYRWFCSPLLQSYKGKMPLDANATYMYDLKISHWWISDRNLVNSDSDILQLETTFRKHFLPLSSVQWVGHILTQMEVKSFFRNFRIRLQNYIMSQSRQPLLCIIIYGH